MPPPLIPLSASAPHFVCSGDSTAMDQARRQNSVTGGGGGGRNKGGTSSLFCVNSRGAREIYPSLDQVNKVRSKDSRGFSGQKQMISKKKVFTEIAGDFPPEIANSSSFSGRKQVISKKKVFIPKTSRNSLSVHKKHQFGPRFALQ